MLSNADVVDYKLWGQQWRSIILSSVEKTMYPYALYIKSLSLGNLESFLEDIAPHLDQRAEFFEGEMQPFDAARGGLPSSSDRQLRSASSQRGGGGRGGRFPFLDKTAIVNRVGESVTSFAKAASDRAGRRMQLTSLEGHHLRQADLSRWLPRLATLRSLRLRDGSVLGADVGRAIAASCPAFSDLTCHYCDGDGVDDDVAAFLAGLAPNSLASFTITSVNRLGRATFRALADTQARSLRHLDLSRLGARAVLALPELDRCDGLASLGLEGDKADEVDLRAADRPGFYRVVNWLRACADLTDLSISHVTFDLPLLTLALSTATHDEKKHVAAVSPAFRLRSLRVTTRDDETSIGAFFQTLNLGPPPIPNGDDPGHAFIVAIAITAFKSWPPAVKELETVEFRCQNDEPMMLWLVDFLAATLAGLTRLRVLNIMDTPLEVGNLAELCISLPRLEELSFDGRDAMGAEVLQPLLLPPRLQMVQINAVTTLGIWDLTKFFDAVVARSGRDGYAHDGFRLHILNQWTTARMDEDLLASLGAGFRTALGGRLDVMYMRDGFDSDGEGDSADLSD